MASSSNADYSFSKEVQLYPYPTHVNTANFLSIKLSGKTNYRSWQEQMTCLLDSHDMLGFIEGTIKHNQGKNDSKRTHNYKEYREWKRSDMLVKGWIFGSLNEDVMDTVVGLHTSHHVWKQLKNNYDILPAPTSNTGSDRDSSKYQPLYGAVVNGYWEKAREYFIKDKDALTCKINDDDDSPLHVAIGTCQNIYFVKNLLKELNSESLPYLVCKRQQTPLHRAALVGNTKAAKKLVKRNPKLLFITDKQRLLPIHRAIFGAHVNTFLYLLEVTKKHIGLSQLQGHSNPFRGLNAAALLTSVIGNGLFEVAYELIKEYPDMARTKKDISIPLKSIAGKLDAYLSGTKYNFYQNFVYHYVPIKDHNLDNGHEIDQDIENQVRDTTTPNAKGRRSCSNSVFGWIYVKLWEVLVLHVAHVKRLHEDKVKHNKAALVLKSICRELQKLENEGELREHYHEAVLLALEHDNTEAIEEIIKTFPQAIWTKQDDLHLIQLSILNRCENVYSFLVHKAVTDKHVHKILTDKDGNNILHLAGQLAPIHKLNMVSGAALQMQRELQWFEEVKRFALHRNGKTKNKKQETPIMVFRREHKELRKEGEEWMKKTADSYTITAALIITIVFAAAITVPGGTDGNSGKPIYDKDPGFIIFVVSDAISLFTATTSLLMCLSILTTRYRDEDFLYRLPKRLIIGLGLLFLSVTSMMIAFSATLYIMFAEGRAWILYPIAALTCLPIISFVRFQLPLLFDLYTSTYGQGIFDKQSDEKIKLH
uniref:protein ACCELERATED CELL DEATH 6-like n=1 Tax=Erigeron canadensis TaxID=72917 RepID=UPI001CB96B47|nr:protein ACCELERATED CELL DEATH 6-like [Erigeron canadensis]